MALNVFTLICGRTPDDLNVGVISDEFPLGISFCKNLTRGEDCDMDYLSCIYIEKLQSRTLDLIEYKEVDAAIKDIKSNKIWGLIHFPEKYSEAIITLIEDPSTNDSWVFDSTAFVYMDYSNYVFKNFIERDIHLSYLDMLKDIFSNCSWPIEAATLPIKFQDPIYGKSEADLTEYYIPPLIAMFTLATPLLYGLTVMVEEKRIGASARSIIAGVNIFEIVIAHFVVQFALQVFQTLMVLVVTYGVLQFPVRQPLLFTLALVLGSTTGIAFAFAVATFIESLAVSGGFIYGFSMILLMLGGLLWPIEGIPFPIRIISWMIPSTFLSESLRSIIISGKGLEDKIVYRGFISSLGWLMLYTLFLFIYLKRTRGKTFLN